MLEKVIAELGEANDMLLENLAACMEDTRDLKEKMKKMEKNPDPVKVK